MVIEKILDVVEPKIIFFNDCTDIVRYVTWSSDKYKIKKIEVLLNNSIDRKIQKVYLYGGENPRSDMIDRRILKSDYCLCSKLKNKVFNEETRKYLFYTIGTWNLNYCHFWPNLHENFIKYEGRKLPLKNPFNDKNFSFTCLKKVTVQGTYKPISFTGVTL